MKAIIMAGGEGSRLRPLTCDCPKPMLRLMGRPLMEYAIRLLKQHGADEIAATLAYLPEDVQRYFGDGEALGVSMRYYIESTPLGTAGSVARAADFLNETFFVLSGDGITDFDLSAALRFHREKHALATLLLCRSSNPQEYGMVVTAPDGRIRSFHEKPGRSDIYSDLINSGVYILEPELLSFIPRDQPWDFGHDLFPALLKQHLPVYGCIAGGYWCDVGDVAAYLRVHFDALDGRISLIDPLQGAGRHAGANITPPVYIAPDAQIDPGACIGPYSVIGAGCRVAAGAGIKRSLLLPECQVGGGAQLRGCIAGRGSMIGGEARLFEESVVGSASRIGRRAMLPPGVKIWPGKQILEGERPEDNIVWGFRCEDRFEGGALMLSSPTQTARAVQACMQQMQPREMLIGCESSPVSAALCHAAISGAMAQGVQVVESRACTLPQLRHALASLHCGGALLVRQDRLIPLDDQGCLLTEKQQRSILKLLERQDYPCPFSRVTPPPIDAGNTAAAYIADLAACFRADAASAPGIAFSAPDAFHALAQQLCLRCGLQIRFIAPGENPRPTGDEIGVRLSGDGARAVFSDALGELSEVQRQIACAWTAVQLGQRQLMLPIHWTRSIARLGAQVRYLGGEEALWMQALSRHSPLQFRLQLDGLFLMISFLSLLGEKGLTLDAWRKSMPDACRSASCLDIPAHRGGHLLHALAEGHPGAELGGGMRLKDALGWTWLSPGEGGRLHIFSEAASMEAARELCAFYEGEIRRLMARQD